MKTQHTWKIGNMQYCTNDWIQNIKFSILLSSKSNFKDRASDLANFILINSICVAIASSTNSSESDVKKLTIMPDFDTVILSGGLTMGLDKTNLAEICSLH